MIPAAIGTDINCGMRLLSTGVPLSLFERAREGLLARLRGPLLEGRRDVPVPSAAFRALFDVGPLAWIDSLRRDGLWARVDRDRLARELEATIGLSALRGAARYAPDALMPSTRESVRDPALGTVGSGNHFVELQVVDGVLDRKLAYAAGLRAEEVVVMLHSGSRDVGFYVGQRWMDRARGAWPQDLKHPQSGLYGLTGLLAAQYLEAMGMASRDVSDEWAILQKGMGFPIHLSLVQLHESLTGTARYSTVRDTVDWLVIHGHEENVVSSTALQGTVDDSAIVLEIAGSNETKGRYSGSFQPDGRLSGITVDVNRFGSQAIWFQWARCGTERARLLDHVLLQRCGVSPSCNARRMFATALPLKDNVLPRAQVR